MTEILTNPVFTTWDSNFSLWSNTLITLYMTAGTMLLSTLVGVPLGVALFETSRSPHGLTRWINRVVGFAVNVGRSFPFIILIIALIPVTRFVVGRVTGPNAAMFALTISAIPFLARLIEINLQEVAAGKIEAVRMMGATRFQVIRQVLLPEAARGTAAPAFPMRPGRPARAPRPRPPPPRRQTRWRTGAPPAAGPARA